MAESIWESTIFWVLLILFFIIFIFVFYSPAEGFMGKVAKLALAVEKLLPVEPSKQVKQDTSLPQSTTDTQKRFMEEISKYYDKEKCVLSFSSLEGLGDYKMELSSYESKVTSRILGKDERKLNPIDTGDKELKMCVINAKAFYNCYLSDNKDCTQNLYREKDFIQLTKNRILIDENTYRLAQGLLFKPTKNDVCFIPIYIFQLTIYPQKWGCDASENMIDEACLEKIKQKIPSCS